MLQLTAALFKRKLMKYHSSLFYLAYSWCNNRDTALDLTQESLEKALTKRHQLTNPNALKSWLAAILSNCWKDYLRKQRPVDDIDSVPLASQVNLEKEHDRNQVIIKVRNSISRLPIKQRQVITLVDIFELSYTQVASILDIPVGTVMSRLSRARESLRQDLIDYSSNHVVSGQPGSNLRSAEKMEY